MSTSRPSFLLVDGNNILYAWSDLAKLLLQDRERARQELIRQLTEYRQFSGQRTVLVFDGRASSLVEEREAGGLQVIYSSSQQAADGVIESLVRRYGASFELIVATDDRAIQDVAIGAGGEVISADALRSRVLTSRQEMDRWLERQRRK